MARLYDPVKGTILLNGSDIRSYSPDALSRKIGFILQEPFLFTGTVGENIRYAHEDYHHQYSGGIDAHGDDVAGADVAVDFAKVIADAKLEGLLSVFEEGLETKVLSAGDGLSLGQKQIIAFMRAVLRKPDLLILDEATANIDTITEKLLGDILDKLPRETTLVIIAHRLNTIENADEIFFVNSGEVIQAGSFEEAMDKLIRHKRKS
jgi:ATP-binding cassette subfamily B protein